MSQRAAEEPTVQLQRSAAAEECSCRGVQLQTRRSAGSAEATQREMRTASLASTSDYSTGNLIRTGVLWFRVAASVTSPASGYHRQ